MVTIDLSRKAILITGALGAIAEHMVRRLSAAGATLTLTDIKPEAEAKRTLHERQIPPSAYTYFAAGNVATGSSLKVFEEDSSYREFVLRVSMGRRNRPESIADAFVFLCSPLAAEINGQVLSPDYGAGIGNRL